MKFISTTYIYERPLQREGVLLSNKQNDFEYYETYDADTIKIRSNHDMFSDKVEKYDNGVFRIRFSGIDASELSGGEPLSDEGKVFTKRILDNAKEIRIDIRTHKDGTFNPGDRSRPVGIIYAQMPDGRWVNINRSLLANWFAVPVPSFLRQTNIGDEGRQQWELDYLSGIVRAEQNSVENNKDVREDYLGNFDPLKEVRIGDVQLPISPEAIQVTTINKTAQDTSKVIRNNTTLVSTTGHNIKQLRLSFYVNGLKQINGIKKQATDITGSPVKIITNAEDIAKAKEKGEEIPKEHEITPTYYINGLRCLLSQFKLTPFLPIENYHINVESDISAITLQSLSVENVHNFPNTLRVTLVCLEFNHQVYIDTIKPFKDIFDWDLFRFYYQRLLEGTNMGYMKSKKFPLVKSLGAENFSFDVVDKTSLQRREQAERYLKTVPRNIDYALENNESIFATAVHDSRIFQDAVKQYQQWQNIKHEFSNSHNMTLSEYIEANAVNNFEDMIVTIGDLRTRLNNYCENSDDLYFNRKFFYPFVADSQYYFTSFGHNPKYNSYFHLSMKNDKNLNLVKNKVATIDKNTLTEEKVAQFKELENAIEVTNNEYTDSSVYDSRDFEINTSEPYLTVSTFDSIKSEVINDGKQKEQEREDAIKIVHEGEDLYTWNHFSFNNVIIQNIGVAMSNRVNTVNVNMQTRPAHQYLGSKEIVITLDFISKDTGDIQKLNALINHTKEMNLRFSEIIDTPLVRLNNSLVNIFGLDGVFIRDIDESTIPNFPGSKLVQMSFIGYYKPPKDFESLSRLYKSEASNYLSNNIDKEGSKEEIETLFAIKEQMKKINLYPDLDLPKYCELPKGFELRNPDSLAYVDPDFYALNVDRMFVDEALKVLHANQMPYWDGELYGADSFGEHLSAVVNEKGEPKIQQEEPFDIDEIDFNELLNNKEPWPANHFDKEEFSKASDVWPVKVTERFRELLIGLDLLRETINEPIIISSAVRDYSKFSESKHLPKNYCAVDIYSTNYSSVELMKVVEELNIFTGRGVYPYTNSQIIHVDTRSGLSGEDNKIVRWYRDNDDNYYDSNNHYDVSIHGAFNGYLQGVKLKINNSVDETAEENNVSERVKQIYDKIDPHRSKINIDSDDPYHTSYDIYSAVDKLGLDNPAFTYESKILTAAIIHSWNEKEYKPGWFERVFNRKLDSDSLTAGWYYKFTEDKLAFDIPKKAIDRFKDYHRPYISNIDTQFNHYFEYQVLALAGMADTYFKMYLPLINQHIEYLSENTKNILSKILSCTSEKDYANAISVAKIMSYMHVYGITLDDMADGKSNFSDFMKTLIGVFEDFDWINQQMSNEELNMLEAHISDFAKEIVSGEDADYEDLANIKSKIKDTIKLRPPEERYADSFRDMLQYDQRGRLLRAFPTYYLMLIDEGRDLWVWQLQDLFYEYSGVESIDVVRSKSNIADACYITMSNNSRHLSDATGGFKKQYDELGFWETVLSILPFDDFNLEKAKREKEYKSVQLQTGARLHLRLGYGSNPLKLPTVFSGVITELQLGNKISLIAQNDGIELNKPIEDAGPRSQTDNQWFGLIESPKEIITDLLGDRGGNWATFWRWISTKFDKEGQPWLYEDNVHGIRHLGAIARPAWWDSTYIAHRHPIIGDETADARNYEVGQNIYSANFEDDDNEDIAFSMFLYGKTPYDVLQTCAMVAPNYIAAIHPFSIGRNTIFYGHPTFDLAFDYIKDENGNIKEDIKPYRQMHVYGSFYDIVANNIKASSNIYTAVKPVMADKDGDVHRMDPLFLDSDIYPEHQKQVTVDTSISVAGPIESFVQNYVPFIWNETPEKNAARRFGASTLKQYVSNMYQGPLVVLGDPTAKPYDYSYLYDMEEQMNGMFEIDTVVHSLNKKTGFITSIEPDPVIAINKGIKRDMEYWMWAKSRMGSIYRNFFTTRALMSVLLQSKAIGRANLTHLLAKAGVKIATKQGKRFANWAKRLNGAVDDLLRTLNNAGETTINPAPWKSFRAKAWAGKIESVRDGAVDSVKYVSKYMDEGKDLSKAMKMAKGARFADRFALDMGRSTLIKRLLGSILNYGDEAFLAITTGGIGIAIEMYLEHIVFKRIGDFLRRKRDNLEVLTMMPLSKNGSEFTAGINGHKGSVIGDKPGALDQILHGPIFNFFLGEEADYENQQLLKEEITQQAETMQMATRERMQTAYTAQYGKDYAVLYDQDKISEYYKNIIQEQYNNYSSKYNSLSLKPATINNLGEADFTNREKWISQASRYIHYNADKELEEYKHHRLAKDLARIVKDLDKGGVKISTQSIGQEYDRLYNNGLAVSFKTTVSGKKQDIVNKATVRGIKSIYVGADFVHIDLGPKKVINHTDIDIPEYIDNDKNAITKYPDVSPSI